MADPGAVRTIRFSQATEAALAEMAAATNTTEAEVILNALSLSWWAYRELGRGSKLLIQRGDVVTELVVSALKP